MYQTDPLLPYETFILAKRVRVKGLGWAYVRVRGILIFFSSCPLWEQQFMYLFLNILK